MRTTFPILAAVILTAFVLPTHAQDVSIPDPGLNAAVREALQKPAGPLTQQDLLSLTNLNARNRNVKSIVGLEAARNLIALDLQINRLTNFSLPAGLTKLMVLDVSVNPLTNFFLPGGLTNLTSLTLESAGLTNLNLPAGLTRLNNLDLENNQFTSFNPLSNLTSLVWLNLGFNAFTNFSLPGGLTNLRSFYFAGNPLTSVTLPPGLAGMEDLNLSQNLLTSFTLPAGMTNLIELDLFFNQLTNLTLPADLRSVTALDLDFNRLSSLSFLSNVTGLRSLHLRANQFTNFNLPAGLTGLTFLDVSMNPVSKVTLPAGLNQLTTLRLSENTNLTSLTLPVGMTNLIGLHLAENQLTNVVLPSDLARLETLNLGGNRLTSLNLPSGLTNLVGLFVVGNLMTNLTLPPDMTRLTTLGFLSNPLTTLVLSEPLAASTNLTVNLETIAALPSQGVAVFTYPLVAQLVRPLALIGAFKFAITGPPGVYSVLGSTNLTDWNAVGVAANPLGGVNFHDVTANASPQKFYRAVLQSPPTNMVFIPPNTFTMGSPNNEVGHQADEGPQTVVTLTRGFWIGKYEVTQREYLAVTGENPSGFPGDLDRPVETVSFFAASNYCVLLTAQDQAAGRISLASHYRLPTEAEWECAARAGSSTRFSYGDDPDLTGLSSYAWFGAHNGITTHPVGQKLPNAWGLYDMEGNVWEWCQDWYGDYPGGAVTDPQGSSNNPIGWKVIRGGAWESSDFDCRSASRWFEGASPFIHDFILGFRVVLVTESE
ncbi:MAG: SUMF1/EgtB/PvdO family nonheme iron enzyme [Verrucomicrobia subdivision 3 bacterium]|nr:SUMF1/EgtB/PvdO family nonheme iron enzyme [Limisphaerales bacterium]